jgi:hypothetical protein
MTTNLFPRAIFPKGKYLLGPISIPEGIIDLTVLFHMPVPPSLTAELYWNFEFSYDDGKTWLNMGSAGLSLAKSGYIIKDGELKDSGGNPAPVSGRRFSNIPDGDKRILRGMLIVKESLELLVTLDM